MDLQKNWVDIAILLKKRHKAYLEDLERHAVALSKTDFLWSLLVHAFATMGSAAGWDRLSSNTESLNYLRYDNLLKLINRKHRESFILEIFKKHGIRFPNRKASFLVEIFAEIKELGGPVSAQKALLRLHGREKKILFLKRLPGIGDKYARHILMCTFHPDFRQSIAIDTRIKTLTSMFGFRFSNYESHEKFLLEIASKANITGWELDRLMFWFYDEWKSEIKKRRK